MLAVFLTTSTERDPRQSIPTMATISSSKSRKGLVCALVVSFIFSANHFCRDAPGTVEEQIARDPLLAVTPSRYGLITAVYFTPSAIVPLALGLLSSVWGVSPEAIFHCCAWISVIGNTITGVGVAKGSFATLLFGRGMVGTVYEAVDMMPLGFLPQMLPEGLWPTCSGILNTILRLGSVAAFVTLPLVYDKGGGDSGNGIRNVFIVVAMVGSTIGPLATASWFVASGRADKCFKEKQEGSIESKISQATEIETEEFVDNGPSTQKNVTLKERRGLVSTVKSVPLTFWMYAFVGTALYGSVVPFWFYGSGFLQTSRGFSLRAADGIMVSLEGVICILFVPTGVLITYFRLDFVRQQWVLAVANFCVALSYILLASGAPAYFGIVALGCSYAVSVQTFWSAFPDACPPQLASLGAGIAACFVNVGATVAPLLIGVIDESFRRELADVTMLLLLASFALVGSCIAISIVTKKEDDYNAVITDYDASQESICELNV